MNNQTIFKKGTNKSDLFLLRLWHWENAMKIKRISSLRTHFRSNKKQNIAPRPKN